MNIKQLFHVSRWDVAYRKITSETCFDFLAKGQKPIFEPIKDTKEYSFADPLFYSDEDGDYLFVEAINKKTRKGSLGVFDFNNGLGEYHPILEEKFHLSYPLVFKKNGEHFLMPESNNAHELLLYKAKEYPFKWELFKVLVDGIDCVDTTIYTAEGDATVYLLSYVKQQPNNKLRIYKLEEDFHVTMIEEIEDKECSLRGAGNFFSIGDVIYRPSQYCKGLYGQSLIFNRFEHGMPSYKEKPDINIKASDVIINKYPSYSVTKIHTYSKGGGYEFIDFWHGHFSLLKPIKKLIDKISR